MPSSWETSATQWTSLFHWSLSTLVFLACFPAIWYKAQTVVCSIIASCLDYCNAILQGTPLTIFDKLQNNLVNRIAGTIFIGRADSFPYFFSPLSLLSLSSFSLPLPFPFRPLEVDPLWLRNSLPSNLWQSDLTLHQFRRALKTHLFGRLRLQHQVTFVFSVLYKCTYLLTYLLTYSPFHSLHSRPSPALPFLGLHGYTVLLIYRLQSWPCGWPTADTLPTKWSHVNHRSVVDHGKFASQTPTS